MRSNSFKLAVFAVALFASSTLFSFVVADKLAADIWARLGINKTEGTDKIRRSFLDGYLNYYGVSGVKSLAATDRAAVSRDLIVYAKQYLSTPTFKVEYDKMRTGSKPVSEIPAVKTKDQIRAQQIEEAKKAIENLEKVARTMPAAQQKEFASTIEMYRKNIKDYQDPKNQLIDMMYQGEVDTHEHRVKRANEEMKKWETEYPVDVKEFVKRRLQHYLDVASTVDFSAELMEKYGKKRFVKQAYESKNNEWKMIYRAGKDVYNETKPFVEQWLKEL